MSASMEPEEQLNTETEEETMALRKKRSRRVSFAEITSVHVFDRDEDFETPPDAKPTLINDSAEEDEVLGFLRDLGDLEDYDDSKDLLNNGNLADNNENDDDVDEDEDEDAQVMDGRKRFLRPMESPSPGSTIGSASATSDGDEDNFFGPVSASFIRPGRLSDSAASDDNYDVTMDSTAFSMHFRSLARSESGGDFKTPTGIHFSFEQKTPTLNSTPSKLGSFMSLTGDKKLNLQSPIPAERVSGGKDSNDMSLVGENPHKYDYARLSPRLDALLAEGSKDLPTVSDAVPFSESISPNNPIKESEVFKFSENGNDRVGMKDSGDMEAQNLSTHGSSAKNASVGHIKVSETNGNSAASPIEETTCSSNTNDGLHVDASADHEAQSPNQLTRGFLFGQSKESVEDSLETSRLKLEFSDSGTLKDMDNRVHQLDLPGQHVSKHLHSSGGSLQENSPPREGRNNFSIHNRSDQQYLSPLGLLKFSLSAKEGEENSPRDGRHNSDAVKNSEQKYQAALGVSISSLSAQQRQDFLDSAKSRRHAWILTPEKQPGSFLSEESIRQSKSTSSIQKSISKLCILRASPYFSSINDGNNDSQQRSSDFIDPFHTNSKDPQSKHLDVPVARLEDQFLSTDQKEVEHGIVTDTDSNSIKTTIKNLKNLSQTNETTDNSSKSKVAEISSSQFPWSGVELPQHLLSSDKFTGGTPINSRADSSLVEITLHHGKDKKPIDSPEKFVSSQAKSLKNLSAPPEYEGILARDLKYRDQSNELVSIGSEEDGNSMEIVTSGSQLSAKVQKKDSIFVESKPQYLSPLIEIFNSQDSNQMDGMDSRSALHQDLQKDAETYTLQTPLRKVETLNFQLETPGKSGHIGPDLARLKSVLPVEGRISSPCSSTSPSVHGSTNEPPLQKSPFRKESCNASNNDNVHPSVENSSARKRKSEEIVIREGDQRDEIVRFQKNPKVQKDGGNDMMLECSNESNIERRIGGDLSVKHWSDMFSEFSAEIEQLRSPLIDKLNLKAIGVMEDVLVHLQKVNTFEMLCSDIQSQKTSDRSSEVRHKRASETRSLLCRMIYEKAKLQLLSVKRERLRKRVDLLRYGTEESQSLQINSFQDVSVPSVRDTQVDPPSLSAPIGGKHEVACDKVTTMRHEVEASERKIKHLTNSFHTLCKVKEELSSADTVVLVNDHLKKRTCFRFIRQDLQLWEVDGLESRNGHHDVVLNYHGFISQRFTVGSPVSSINVLNKLNDIHIMKKFPNMEACTAFAFVLNADNTRKYVGKRSLAQETQMTSSLLCNLLDVIEEVSLARVELSNLTGIRFQSPSVEQLDLQLYFTDIKSGEKVILTLDMTCLNCGVYPSETIPSQLQQAPNAVTQKSPPQSLLAEIKASIESLQIGYLRILRLCRCVSQVVQTSIK